jgi:predicted transcriptional regulator
MHACLLQIYDCASLLFLFYYDLSLIIGHGYVLQCYLNKDRSFIMLTSCIWLYSIYMFYQFPNDVQIADR